MPELACPARHTASDALITFGSICSQPTVTAVNGGDDLAACFRVQLSIFLGES
jgi:hypothetical protein